MPSIEDSKVLTAEQREKAYLWLVNNSWYSTAIINHRMVDKLNVYQATLHAMRPAVIQLHVRYPELKGR